VSLSNRHLLDLSVMKGGRWLLRRHAPPLTSAMLVCLHVEGAGLGERLSPISELLLELEQ
jgi:hypothetical protein